MTTDTRFDDATALRARLDAGELTPVEAVEEAIARSEAAHPHLNAVIHPRYDAARDDARAVRSGPLGGVPVLVKDLGCEQAGEPHHHGARFLKELGWTGGVDSYLWRSIRDAGAICLGRTNTPEFGSTITTEPLAYGATHNPWNLLYSPGGSSGGSAAAVAAGIVPLAHGNDGGGSIRVPASACGLVGLKPGRGRVSTGPESGEHRGGFAVDGMLTRTVRDAALALDVISRPWPGEFVPDDPPPGPWAELIDRPAGRLRIAVSTRRAHPDCAGAVDRTATLLTELGHEIVPDTHPPDWYDPEVTDQTIVVRTIGMARELDTWAALIGRSLSEDDVEQSNWWSAEIGRTLSGTMYVSAIEWLRGWTRRVAGFWQSYDLLLTPVLGAPPPPLGHLSDPVEGQARLRELIGFVDQANVSGQPAVSLPTGSSADGLPVGVQLVADRGREDILLRVARQVEGAGGFVPLPDLSTF
jgi:amidase